MASNILILYGSQTGNTEEVAREVHDAATSKGYESKITTMNAFDEATFPKEGIVILMTSTTLDGEPPDNGAKFVRWLKRKTHSATLLSAVKYTVLGLGDSTYAKFCGTARTVDTRMAALGATSFYPRGEADDAVGLEVVTEPWVQGLWDAIEKATNPAQPEASPAPSTEDKAKINVVVNGTSDHSAPSAEASGPPAPSKRLVVAFGSQTGNAASIAKTIGAKASQRGWKCSVVTLNQFEERKMAETEDLVIIVSSSTGDGDPPENATRFYKWVRNKSHPLNLLSKLKYAVLGLGDTNYSKFCCVPRTLDQRLAALGATAIYPRGDADEVSGLEATVEPWVSGVLSALDKLSKRPEPLSSVPPSVTVATLAPSSPSLRPISPSLRPMSPLLRPISPSDVEAEFAPGELPELRPSRLAINYKEFSTGPDHDGALGVPRLELGLKYLKRIYSPLCFGPPSHDAPGFARIVRTKMLTTPDAVKQVVHLELDVRDLKLQWAPGDAVGIYAPNDPQLVNTLLKRLRAPADSIFFLSSITGTGVSPSGRSPSPSNFSIPQQIRSPCTLREAFLYYCDIASQPKRGLLRLLAHYATDKDEKRRLLRLSSLNPGNQPDPLETYDNLIAKGEASLLDLLNLFPSCQPDVAHLIDTLPALQPRYYSLSSSPLAFPHTLHIAASVVDYVTPPPTSRRLHGVCSSFLNHLHSLLSSPGSTGSAPTPTLHLPVFHRPGGEGFTVPARDVPMIMIGPGTGVAPFRSFIQHLQQKALQEVSSADSTERWLFFGCRHPDKDFLYRDDFESSVASAKVVRAAASAQAQNPGEGFWNTQWIESPLAGVLTRLVTAFSRCPPPEASPEPSSDPPRKMYVQTRLLEHSAEVARLIVREGARVYVCGDAQQMARDVEKTLLAIFQSEVGMSAFDAAQLLASMSDSERYIRDIWS